MPSDMPSTQFATDFTAVRSRNAVTFTYSAASYSGVEEVREENDETRDAGFIREYEYGIFCLRDDFVSLPNIGAEFSNLNGGTYQVVKRTFSPDGLIVVFGLDTVNK